MTARAVRHTAELERILNLPRRMWTEAEGLELARQMTEALKTQQGTMTLHAIQAQALHDIAICKGGLVNADVGNGKSLISLMAAYVLEAQLGRPLKVLLLMPAGLIKKTIEIEIPHYSQHFLVPKNVRLFSYDMLGLEQSEQMLEDFGPDLVITDEFQKFRNRRASRTRRMDRYMKAHPETMFVAMSGSIMENSIEDFSHVLRWALKGNAPVPKTDAEVEEWAQALNDNIPEEGRYEPGALLKFCSPEDEVPNNPIATARRGFRRRLFETPGVVSGPSIKVDALIKISAVTCDMKSDTDVHFARLRNKWETPDGWPLTQAAEVWAQARQLALGFHYVRVEKTKYENWLRGLGAKPPAGADFSETVSIRYRREFLDFLNTARPPQEWMDARREWCSFVREVISRSRTLDSERVVERACEEGRLDGTALRAWRRIQPIFTPQTVAVWHDDSTINLCLDWMKKPGVVWCDHVAFAERLSEMSGRKYFGQQGKSPDGQLIDYTDHGVAIIASIKANKEGRNLQAKWSRSLVVSPSGNSSEWHQKIGRFHRVGVTSSVVSVEILLGCAEHVNSWRDVIAKAEGVQDTTGVPQKILMADIDWPSFDVADGFRGPRWERTLQRDSDQIDALFPSVDLLKNIYARA